MGLFKKTKQLAVEAKLTRDYIIPIESKMIVEMEMDSYIYKPRYQICLDVLTKGYLMVMKDHGRDTANIFLDIMYERNYVKKFRGEMIEEFQDISAFKNAIMTRIVRAMAYINTKEKIDDVPKSIPQSPINYSGIPTDTNKKIINNQTIEKKQKKSKLKILGIGIAVYVVVMIIVAIFGGFSPDKKQSTKPSVEKKASKPVKVQKADIPAPEPKQEQAQKEESGQTKEIKTQETASSPDIAKNYLNQGISHYKNNNYQQAIREFNKIIEMDDKSYLYNAYSMRGISYFRLNDLKSSIEDFNKAIELKPNDKDVYYVRGLAYSKLDNTNQANLNAALNDFITAARLGHSMAQEMLKSKNIEW